MIALIVQSCLLIQLASCTSTRSLPIGPDFARQEPRVNETPGLSITGYVTADGVSHPFKGTVTMEQDTLVFHPIAQTRAAVYPASPAVTYGRPFRLVRAEVASLNRVVPNNVNIVLITVGVLALFFGLGLLLYGLE